jgi:hypothetical protein
MTAQDDPTGAKRKGAAPRKPRVPAAPAAPPKPRAAAAPQRDEFGAQSQAGKREAGRLASPKPRSRAAPATPKGAPAPPAARKARGFLHAAALSSEPIRTAFSRRGFAETRVLTDWPEVVGDALAPLCRPVKVTYAAGGFGATLVVLAEGARAPEVEMLGPRIIERVNAFYGYRAVSRFKVVQTASGMGAGGGAGMGAGEGAGMGASGGFFEDAALAPRSRQSDRMGAPERRQGAVSEAEAQGVAAAVRPVASDSLRQALDRLGRNIISRRRAAVRKDQPA